MQILTLKYQQCTVAKVVRHPIPTKREIESMVSNRNREYRIQERDFLEELLRELHDMVKQDPMRLYGYIAQNIIGVLVSPVWDIYEASAVLPDDQNRSQAAHVWHRLVHRVAVFCSETEPRNVGREQPDWILLRIYQEIFAAISSQVITARMQQAPNRT